MSNMATNKNSSNYPHRTGKAKTGLREDTRIALLWGGWSDERDISHASAQACEKALREAGFVQVEPLDIADHATIERLFNEHYDVAFIAMHGEYGEDGCIQGLLDILHIPYTFSGVLASALASDKNRAKSVFKAAGIAVPASFTVSRNEFREGNPLETIKTKLRSITNPTDLMKGEDQQSCAGTSGERQGDGTAVGEGRNKGAQDTEGVGEGKKSAQEPNSRCAAHTKALFVKPVHNGSSFGITRVAAAPNQEDQTAKAIANALHLALAKDEIALVEEAIEGTEISVPVIGNADARPLPVIEIVMDSEFYDLKTKYEPSELHHIIPARLDQPIYEAAQKAAVKAHRALGCRGCSRSDFIVATNGTPYLLETNTIPGMTETSLLPDSASKEGISFAKLCATFVDLAQCDNA